MSDLIYPITIVFGLVAIGYGFGVLKLLPVATGDHLSKFVFTVAVPILLFRTMISADFQGAVPWQLWVSYFTGVGCTWALGTLVIRRVFGRDARAGVVAGLAASFSNLVVLGIPFALGIFGEDGLEILLLIISIHLLFMMLTSVILFEHAVRADGVQTEDVDLPAVARRFVRNLFSNPIVVGILAGWMWRLLGWPLPPLIDDISEALAKVAGPVALFAVGLTLLQFGFLGNVKQALAVSVIKLVFMPLVVLVLGLLVGLPPLALQVAVAAASLPSGSNPYLIASHFGTGEGLASNALTISTALAVATTLGWMLIVRAILNM